MVNSSICATESYDLVVIGAGISGLNALNAATEYLPPDARVLLVDEKDSAGGSWNIAYDYVRLHQPHPMFTVGNNKWDWSMPRGYLAARDEVQAHLAKALEPISKRVNLTINFCTRAIRCEEKVGDVGPYAEIVLNSKVTAEETRTIRASRAIQAAGLNYTVYKPLPLSSEKIHSIIPQDFIETLRAVPGKPVFVVGGGKTGMDTILAALSIDATREVTLIKGRGTIFYNRSKFLPDGVKRWTSGKLLSRVFRDLALNFDGTNEENTVLHAF